MLAAMKTHLAIAALAIGVSVGTLLAQGFNVRTGTWQYTITIKSSMPMEGIPPEVQKQLLADLSKPQTTTGCLTPDDLKQLNLGRTDDNDDEDCKVLSSTFTPATADVVRECAGDDPYTETAHFEASSPQALTGSISRKSAKGAMNMTMAGKWVAAACME
jgi:hypothetical protein